MLIAAGPPGADILCAETRAMMTANQLTPEQRSTARMFGQPLFAAGHGYGMAVAVVMEPERADVLRCRGGVGTIGWPGADGGLGQGDPTDPSGPVFLAPQMGERGERAR